MPVFAADLLQLLSVFWSLLRALTTPAVFFELTLSMVFFLGMTTTEKMHPTGSAQCTRPLSDV